MTLANDDNDDDDDDDDNDDKRNSRRTGKRKQVYSLVLCSAGESVESFTTGNVQNVHRPKRPHRKCKIVTEKNPGPKWLLKKIVD